MNPPSNSSIAYATGVGLIVAIILIYLIATTGFFVGIAVNPYITVVSVILSLCSIYFFSYRQCFLKSATLIIIVWIIAIGISSCLYDYSWDGIEYHQVTIFDLMSGWNPIENPDGTLSLWGKHYARAFEVISACISTLTGNIESGKSVNFILPIATFCILYSRLPDYIPGISFRNRLGLSLVAILNTVWLVQALSFYVDFPLYYYILMTIILVIDIERGYNSQLSAILLSGIIILAVETKFTHMFYEAFTIGCVLLPLYFINRSSFKRVFIISFFAASAGIAIFGFNPYITNIIFHDNPFYPLMGEDAVDIMSYNTPELYFGHNRVINFLLSIYSPADIPVVDSRIGGFGVAFFVIFTFSILFLIYRAVKMRRLDLISYVAVMVGISCVIFRESWWARYIPQFWLFLPLAYYATLITPPKLSFRRMVRILAIFWVGVNTMLVLILSTMLAANISSYRKAVLTNIRGKEVKTSSPYMRENRFESEGITLKYCTEIPDSQACNLMFSPEYTMSLYDRIEVDSIERCRIFQTYEDSYGHKYYKTCINIKKTLIGD